MSGRMTGRMGAVVCAVALAGAVGCGRPGDAGPGGSGSGDDDDDGSVLPDDPSDPTGGSTETPDPDADGDGWTASVDCDDFDPSVMGLATTDGVPYADLGAALGAATTDGAAVTVCAGTFVGPFTAPVAVHLSSTADASLTILTGGGDRVLALPAGSTVTGVTLRDGLTAGSGGGLLLTTPGTLEVTDCVIADNLAADGGGLALPTGATATLRGTVIRGNRATTGGGVHALAGATVDLGDTSVDANEAEGYGGGAFLDDGALLIGGLFTDNEADLNASTTTWSGEPQPPETYTGGGGGIAATGAVRIEGATVSTNTASIGGGLQITDGEVVLVDTSIARNTNHTFFGEGAGVHCLRCTLTMEGTTEIADNAGNVSRGGGIYVEAGTIVGGLVTRNDAPDGGGIYAVDALIDGVDIATNTTLGEGGGALLFGATVVQGSTFRDNSAPYNWGGGFVAYGDGVSLFDTAILRNTAPIGAGLQAVSDLVHLERCTIADNVATAGGGGIDVYGWWSAVELVDGSVTGNTAGWGGGAWVSDDAVLTSTGTDWGTAGADNGIDDVYVSASIGGYYGPPAPIGRGYAYASEAFTCDGHAGTCVTTP